MRGPRGADDRLMGDDLVIVLAICCTVSFLLGFVACVAVTRPVREEPLDLDALGIGAVTLPDCPWIHRS